MRRPWEADGGTDVDEGGLRRRRSSSLTLSTWNKSSVMSVRPIVRRTLYVWKGYISGFELVAFLSYGKGLKSM
jgi:hypothetical protein